MRTRNVIGSALTAALIGFGSQAVVSYTPVTAHSRSYHALPAPNDWSNTIGGYRLKLKNCDMEADSHRTKGVYDFTDDGQDGSAEDGNGKNGCECGQAACTAQLSSGIDRHWTCEKNGWWNWDCGNSVNSDDHVPSWWHD